jgi:hypothetical protein
MTDKQLGPDDYRGQPVNVCQGQEFKAFNTRGYTAINVLPDLWGRPWDDIALGYVHALRPSQLRVVRGGAQADAWKWRVTVWLEDDDKTVKRIQQEVEVGLPDGVCHGQCLEAALQHGKDSPQVAWHNEPGNYVYMPEGAFKQRPEGGPWLPYPRPKKGRRRRWVQGI